jgi:hypothetical protein
MAFNIRRELAELVEKGGAHLLQPHHLKAIVAELDLLSTEASAATRLMDVYRKRYEATDG